MTEKDKKCICPNSQCPRHANCNACKAYHGSTSSLTSCQKAQEKAQQK